MPSQPNGARHAPWARTRCTGRSADGGARLVRRRALARGALALVLLQVPLADADRLRRALGQFVVGDELDGVLERELDRRRERDRLVLAGGADVGELLA